MLNRIEATNMGPAVNSSLIRLIGVIGLAMVAATTASLDLYYAAGSLDPEIVAWPGSGLAQIAGANIVYLLVGAVLLAAISRLSSRPVRSYLIVASIGLLIYLAVPISVSPLISGHLAVHAAQFAGHSQDLIR